MEYLSDTSVRKGALFRLALPIAMQSLISAAVNYADVWVLSAVDQTALSAVSLANQVTFVLTLFYLGITTGLNILSAQYWGKADAAVLEQILGACVKVSLLVSMAFFAGMLLFPSALMGLFTPDTVLIECGAVYLRVLSVSCLVMGFSQLFLSQLKSIGQTRPVAWISSLCLVANIALNMLFVFVVFPGDVQGCVIGVAIATVVSRVAEGIASFWWLKHHSPLRLRWMFVKRCEAWLKHELRNCTLRVQLNYLVWGGALAAISAIIGHVSSEMVSAYAVATSVRNLVTVGCTGLASGGGILLGNTLGAGHLSAARKLGDKLCLLSLAVGCGAGVLLLLLRPLCLTMAVPETETLLSGMLLICAVWCIGKSFNSTLVSGIFCAGGDTGFGLVCDTIGMWVIILPLACCAAFLWHLTPIQIFLILSMDELVKMPFVALHYRKYRWIKDLTQVKESL